MKSIKEGVATASAPRPSAREPNEGDPEEVATASAPRSSPRETIGGDFEGVAAASALLPSPRKPTGADPEGVASPSGDLHFTPRQPKPCAAANSNPARIFRRDGRAE